MTLKLALEIKHRDGESHTLSGDYEEIGGKWNGKTGGKWGVWARMQHSMLRRFALESAVPLEG